VSQGWVAPRCGWRSENWLLCRVCSACWLVLRSGRSLGDCWYWHWAVLTGLFTVLKWY